MAERLTRQEVNFFNREGYLLYEQPVFSPGKFAALQQHFETMLEGWAERSGGLSPESMDTPHFTDPKLFDWLFDDEVLDIVESLVGPDIALWSSHFLCKPAGVGKRVPWHEDSAYWRGRLEPMDVVTIWLAIDPATPDNGCMRVIPGTQHAGFSDYEVLPDRDKQVFGTEIRQDQFDASKAVDCILAPNHCSIHHAKLIHGSNANTGTQRRCGYTMRYMSAAVKHVGADQPWADGFQIYLARGRDLAGNTYGDPTKVNEAWLERHPAARKLVAVG